MHTICVRSLEQLCLNVTVGGGMSLFKFKMECDVALIDDGRLEAHMSVKHECCVKKRGRDKNGPHWSLPPVAAPSPPTLGETVERRACEMEGSILSAILVLCG